MKQYQLIALLLMVLGMAMFSNRVNAQQMTTQDATLSPTEKSIITIASLTAKGDLENLKPALNNGLEAGLTVNQVKEVIVHLYAYCGFPRSIRGQQTFMEVLDERKAKGINDIVGADASAISGNGTKYERGKAILAELTKTPQAGPLKGYSAFAPAIDTFLKEHLFADIFERDILTYAQRELVTIAVISTIGDADPMLQGHLSISLNVGVSPDKLKEFITIIKETAGRKKAKSAKKVLDEVLKNRTE
ncbi:carboxymuconolactone decarboxylase family protein [Flavobacterium subsaxonicum]|uniref:Carboxymuconolactone decarboxylase n=1 Tax=Flavobacterium subsaxonicum WB 4.1-42 = DSM 21790 TaxID=1121898 RepID=A0A0A2MHM9_9FLAO|nr:carboxymuconolactone decarboxylase family protein [Flavobacterium subsaxonicum]KGO90973.1 carboxymuconolactone decarboxylase [Flavobacterium subsaxonicum WB 4.1-42 = DSM 21790]